MWNFSGEYILPNKKFINCESMLETLLSINITLGRRIVKAFNIKFKSRNAKYLSTYRKAKEQNLDISSLPKSEGFLRQVQLANLALLKEFDLVCRNNNFDYWLDYGTLLGAVRHKGFIPWDDDVDVSMPREYYNQILQVFNSTTTNKDFEICVVQNKHHPCMQFLKLKHKVLPFISVDIFPYDIYCTKNEVIADLGKKVYALRQNLHSQKQLLKYSQEKLKRFIDNTLENLLPDCETPETKLLVRGIDFPHPDKNWVYKYEELFSLTDIDFEGLKFKAFKNNDLYLKDIFGNYMAYPAHIELAHTLSTLVSKKEQKVLDDLTKGLV